MSRKRCGRGVRKSKRIKNNPYATKGHKLDRLEGGLITKKRFPDGRIQVTVTSETREQQTHFEQEA